MQRNLPTRATSARFAEQEPARARATKAVERLEKAPTGINGLDEVTFGGLPRGRATLICGSAGCGKTMLGVEFLVNGVRRYSEPGVFVAFEETKNELVVNAASLDFDLDKLVREGKLAIDHVHVDPNEIAETGDYDLEGLFIRLKYAIESVGAKRVVLDTIETLFSGFSNTALLRAEIRRLFQFLKSFGVTAIVTGERGENSLTRFGLEEYVADCVILLDHRVTDQITTRRMRIVKYRGSSHGSNEYPFIIDERGFSVLPVTSMALQHKVSNEAISTGVPDLDAMLGVGGYYQRQHRADVGDGGHGENQFRLRPGAFGMRARRTRAVLRLRRIGAADHPEHAVGGHRSATPYRQRTPADRRAAAVSLWPGDAPGFDAQGGRPIPAERGDRGSNSISYLVIRWK